jgi:hypothetical protein
MWESIVSFVFSGIVSNVKLEDDLPDYSVLFIFKVTPFKLGLKKNASSTSLTSSFCEVCYLTMLLKQKKKPTCDYF